MISEIDSRQGYQPSPSTSSLSWQGSNSNLLLSESWSAIRSLNCSLDGRDLDCHALDGHVLDCCTLDGYALDCCSPDGYALDCCKLQSIVGRENNFCLEEKYIFHVEFINNTRTDIFDQLLQFVRLDNLGFKRCVF